MSFEIRTCEYEKDFEAYTEYLLEHYEDLNLPYPFAMNLSFMSSPLLFGKAILIRSDETYEIAGVAGFVYGTGPKDYKDRHVCQVEIIFLKKEYRNTYLFLLGLKELLTEMKHGNPDVQQVQFWSSPENRKLEKLFSRCHSLPGSTRKLVNERVFYTVPFKELEVYCQSYSTYLKKYKDRIYLSQTRG